MKDFETRQGFYYVEDGGVSKWDAEELSMYLLQKFGEDDSYTEDENFPIAAAAFIKKRMFIGKTCPFCAQTCVWHADKKPHIKGGRIQLYAPDYVISKPFPVEE